MDKEFLKSYKKAIRLKELKMESISKKLNISQGEFSKILQGKRPDISKYILPMMSEINMPLHTLIDAELSKEFLHSEEDHLIIDNLKQQIQIQNQLINALTELCLMYKSIHSSEVNHVESTM